jgi:hypothetical protein
MKSDRKSKRQEEKQARQVLRAAGSAGQPRAAALK